MKLSSYLGEGEVIYTTFYCGFFHLYILTYTPPIS